MKFDDATPSPKPWTPKERRAGCTGVDEAFVPARAACEAKFNSQ
jgi:hypothetical protein